MKKAAKKAMGRVLVAGLVACVLTSLFVGTGFAYGASDDPVFRLTAEADAGSRRYNLDMPVSLDMTGRRGVTFDFRCTDATAFNMMSCYLRSGRGWYGLGSFEPALNGEWSSVRVPLTGFRTEGEPGPLSAVDLVRVAASRGGTNRAEIAVRGIAPYGDYPSVLVVRADSVAKERPKEAWAVKDLAHRFEHALQTCGFDAVTVSDVGFTSQPLKAAQVVVLPYNPDVSPAVLSSLERFVAGGGKVVVAYTSKVAAKRLLDVEYQGARDHPGGWMTEGRFPAGAEILAESSHVPWLVAVPNGAFVARAWRGNAQLGETNEQLTQLMAHVKPELAAEAKTRLRQREARLAAQRAWIRSRPSRTGEMRAMWCHSPFGLPDRPWEEAVKFLKSNGFNMLVPNLCFAQTAYYESRVLPVSPKVAECGDQLALCLKACRAHGVSCHPWRVCYNCGLHATAQQIQRLQAEQRLQLGRDGNVLDRWLCPTHPANRRLEEEALFELAGKGVDGVHLDYIRYPGREGCFCPRCRGLFERRIGHALAAWPADVDKDPALAEQWTQFRCDVISSLVRAVAKRIHAAYPNVKISAAVAGDANDAVKDRGQDWVRWCRSGWLDIACPMDYTTSELWFASAIARQKGQCGKAVLLPGIGLSCWDDPDLDALTLTRHVESVRACGLRGFIVFDFNRRAVNVLPELRCGILRKD